MVPTTAATSPRLEPTDTSISPTKMAKAMPTAIRVYTTEVLKQALMLDRVRKEGLMIPTRRNSAARKRKLVVSLAFRIFFIMHPPFPEYRRPLPSGYLD